MVMAIDTRIELGRRRQFAGEIKHLPSELIQHLKSNIQGEQSEDFYAGLLAGLTVATTLIQANMPMTVSQVTCVVADYCESKELQT